MGSVVSTIPQKDFSESLAHPTAKTNEPSDPLHSACGIRRKHRRVHPVDRRAVAGHGVFLFLAEDETNTRPHDRNREKPQGSADRGAGEDSCTTPRRR